MCKNLALNIRDCVHLCVFRRRCWAQSVDMHDPWIYARSMDRAAQSMDPYSAQEYMDRARYRQTG